MILIALLACAPEPEGDGLTLLSPREQLIRVSVELRGVHPSEEELLAIEADPSLYSAFAERYLADPRVSERIREIFDTRWWTRTGDTYFDAEEAGVSVREADLARSVGDEPLRLLSYVFDQELPYSELVTASYTMADPLLATFWDLDRQSEEPGWVPATYRDGRPHAGLLTMSTIWQRYPSMGGNANRHRANAVSKMLLCDDYLSRPIVLNRAQVDQLTVDPEQAISTNVACQSCHSSLDPLSAHFFGFFHEEQPDGLRAATLYLPEAEQGWRSYSGRSPGYYGVPTSGLEELGQRIAQDPRYYDCAVRTVFEGVLQRPVLPEDWTILQEHRAVFEDADWRLRPVLRSVVLSRQFLAVDAEDPAVAARLTPVRTTSPAQLSAIVEDITGFTWTFDGDDALRAQGAGLPVLMGGIDGRSVTAPGRNPSVGTALGLERFAQAAAHAVAVADLDPARTTDARLLKYVTSETTPESDPKAFEGQIRYLYLRITGIPLGEDAPEPAALTALWKQVYAVEGSSTRAWAGVLSAVLRDPRVLFY